VVAVGDSAQVELIFDVGARRAGRISKKATVTTNDNSRGNFSLSLVAQIYSDPDSLPELRFDPDIVKFDENNRNDKIKVKVHNKTEQDLRMKLVSYPVGILDIDVPDKEIKPGDDREIKIKIDKNFEDEEFANSFTIQLNDADSTRYTIPVTLAKAVMTPQAATTGRPAEKPGERLGK
jgi:hypothetical protein